MPVQVTIIGLGRIGASIGLALAAHKDLVFRVGHDKKIEVEHAAQRKGVIDKTEHNLPRAVQDARIVILSLPISEIRATLEFIKPDLQDGTVVFDTAPVKAEVAKWARDYIPEGSYYVGLVPAVGAEFLKDEGSGLDSARADLFQKSIFLVDAPPGTPGEAVELASNFVNLLGATPMLTDIVESDGITASTYVLPQLISAALLNATVDQPGWKDARKIASRAYSAATSGMGFDDMKSLQMLALQDRTSVIHALDTMIAALHGLRDDIEQGNEAGLTNRLETARDGRENWVNERTSANWVEMQRDPAQYPTLNERLFGSLMGRRTKTTK
jgi:prephenate dehydrogenase